MATTNPGPAVTLTGNTVLTFGNTAVEALLVLTISPAAVAANTTVEQTFTVSGLLPGDFVEMNKPTAQAGLGIVNTRVSALNTLAITFVNATGATVTPTANEVYQMCITRPLAAAFTAGLPTSLPLV